MSARYAQFGCGDETIVRYFTCTRCKGTWCGYVTQDKGRAGAWPLPFNFCPVCGVRFEGEIPRTEAGERHRELRNDAEWKGRDLARATAITYVLETSQTTEPYGWSPIDHWRYPDTEDRKEAIDNWKLRLKDGSLYGEYLRLVARTPRGEKVVLGPVFVLPPRESDAASDMG